MPKVPAGCLLAGLSVGSHFLGDDSELGYQIPFCYLSERTLQFILLGALEQFVKVALISNTCIPI